MEEPRQGAPAARCGRCGSERVGWRVKRLRISGHSVSQLALEMNCRACGASWDEALDELETQRFEERGWQAAGAADGEGDDEGRAPPPG